MTIPVTLTEEIFRRFTMFDMLKRRKVWRSPAIFAAIMCTSGTVCYIMNHVEGAVMLGTLLMAVGLGMPAVYFGSFFSSLKKQVLAYGLKRPQQVYTLTLSEKAKGIGISNEKEHADYEWKQVFQVYRDELATYLFMTKDRAFILPHTCIEEGEEALWKLLSKKVPKARCIDLRK